MTPTPDPPGPRTDLDTCALHALQARLRAATGEVPRLCETHLSWVLLTRRLAFKLKKPLRLPFVDFGTPDLRHRACLEELRLNRRFAPALYLGVLPVRAVPGAAPLDHAVCMRRFADDALLAQQVAAGRIAPVAIDALARRVAAAHEAAPVVALAPADAPARALQPVRQVLAQLQALGREGTRVATLSRWVEAQGSALREVLAARAAQGRVREVHGDLHLGNVAVLAGGEAVPFDALEFDLALRSTDVLADVAFLVMDLQAHGRRDLAFRFLDGWLAASGDFEGLRVLRFYLVYRALVRALVQALSPGVATGASGPAPPDYVAAAEALAQEGTRARLLLTCGVSGSGKSRLAQALLQAAGAVRLRSDVERKRLHGLAPLARPGGVSPLYGHEATARTYERLREGARAALAGGFPTIVDATFLRREARQTFAALAREAGVPFAILHCHADAALLRARVAGRARRGTDPSDADAAVLERQLASLEPLDGDECAQALAVDTGTPVDVPALAARWLGRT